MQTKTLSTEAPPRGFWVVFGERVRICRQLRRYSIRDLAKEIGLSENSVSNIELGRHKINGEIIWKIADFLQIGVETLHPQKFQPNQDEKAKSDNLKPIVDAIEALPASALFDKAASKAKKKK